MRAVAAGFTVLFAVTASGGIQDTILHGVSLSSVKGWVGPDQVAGLTAGTLQAAAESSLSEGEVHVTPGLGSDLLVGATTVVAPSGHCVVYLDARLMEDAKLERNGFSVKASSWHGGAVVSDTRERCPQAVAAATRKVMADFVEQFHVMNPSPVVK